MAVVDNSRVPEILKKLEEIDKYYIVIGVTEKSGSEKVKNDSKSKDPITILQLANIQEYGLNIKVTDRMRGYFLYKWGIKLEINEIKIPERSFLRNGFDDKEDDLKNYGDLIYDVINGDLSVKSFWKTVGQGAAQMIQSFLINNVTSPPNTPFTIANKGGKANPLVDTGKLSNSISYEIRSK